MPTLDAIELAAFTALQALKTSATPPGLFRCVDRYAGEVTSRAGGVSLSGVVLAQNPAVLLDLPGEAADDDVSTTAGQVETRGRVTLRAWVVVQDSRGSTKATKGATGTTGALACVESVAAALNALPAGDLLRVAKLQYRGFQRRIAEPNSLLCYELTFVAERSVPTVAIADTGHAMTGMLGDANIVGDTSTDTNPLDRFNAPT